MKKYYATFLFLLALFLGGSGAARANFISYSETVYNTDFLSAGLGGLRNVGTGAIVLTNLTGTVKKAYLFWHGPMVASATNPAANATIKLNGQTITGVNLGFSSDNCWSTIDTDANYVYSAAYRADVTALVASTRNGSYTLSDTIKAYGYRKSGATNLMGININGASLLVFYDDGNPNNNRDIVLYEGNDSNAQSPFAPNTLGYDDSGWNVKLSGINYTSGPVALQLHISDGQYFEPGDDGDVVLNKTIILEREGHIFSGNTTPRLNDGPYHLGSLWDIKNYIITPYLTPGANSILVTNSAIGFDCISLIVAAVNLPSGAAPHTNAAPTLACQAPVTISPGSAVITSEVFYSAAVPLNYTISVDSVTSLTGTLPSSATPRSAVLSLTNAFSYGQHTVTFNVTDSFGNATCSTLVTVLPGIACSTNIVQSTDPGKSNAVVRFSVATEPAGGAVVCLPASGSVFPIGATSVNCTATDTNGSSATCSFLVTIRDTEPPIIQCPPGMIVSTDHGTNNAIVTYVISATDNLPGVIASCLPPSGSVFPLGVTTVNCIARDLAGNTSPCAFTITVKDTEPPSIQCPTNIVKTLELGKTNAVVTWTIAASDNVPGVTVTCIPPSGSVFQKGSTAVNCTAMDLAGNISSCGFTVIVTDGETPVIFCPGRDIVQQTDPGTNNALVTFNVTATDNLPGVTVVCNPPSGTLFPVGTNDVTCTATDVSGNKASCSFKVIIVDQEPPQITCPANVPRVADAGACTVSNVVYFANAQDNVPGVSVRCEPPSGSAFSTGSTPVTCTATDAAGNHSSCSFLVNVEDHEAPRLTLPGDLPRTTDPGSCSAIVNFDPGATDNCPGQLLVVCVPPSGSTFQKGTTVVTCRATDASGNSVTNTFNITVSDTEAPHVVCPGNIIQPTETGRTDAIVNFTVTATDNCGQATVVSTPASGSRFSLGTNLVTSVATDSSGNTNSCTFLVIVVDQEPPHIACPAPIVRPADKNTCSALNVTYSLSVTDNVALGVSYTCVPPSGSAFAIGTNTVNCTATDAAGNKASCAFTVTIEDKQIPTLTLPPDISQQTDAGSCSAAVSFNPTAFDLCSNPVILVCDPPSGSTFQKGSTVVTCRATDASGNSVTNTFHVAVNDTEAPHVLCPGNVIQPTETGRTDAIVNFTVTATDNCGAATVVNTPASGSRFSLGTNKVTSVATDSSGNTNSCTFLVIVVDQEPPHIVCPAPIVRAADKDTCSALNVTYSLSVTDNVPLGVSYSCVPPSGSPFPLGTNTVNCMATDAAGNKASCAFTVTIQDNQIPTLTVPADISQQTDGGVCSAVVTFNPTAFDLCSNPIILVCSPPSGSTFQKGNTVVTCRATDASGNSVTNTFKVTVNDTEAPHVICPGNIVQPADTGRTDAIVNFTVNATDNCGAATVVVPPASGSRFSLGTNKVTSVATDASGNTNSCTFLVIVVDQEPPHIVCPAPIVRAADNNTCSASNVTYSLSVTDSVPVGVSYACVPPSGSTFPVGTHTVNCTATDAAGNKASCAFTITIEDKQIPTLALPPNISQQTDAGSCSAVVSFNATAFDLCSNPVILVCNPPSGSTFQKGNTVISCRATDASGNSVTNTFNVTVNDTERPPIICPADIHVPSEPGKGSAIVNFTVTATDNCGTPTVVSTPPSGSRFPMGTNVVTSTATDSSGNKSTCTFLVVVGDTQPPTITCPGANITTTNTPGLCSAVVTFVVTANDSKPGTTVLCQPPSGSAFLTGTNLVTCTATDASGNTAQCVFLVIVRDTEKPILKLTGPSSITNECHAAFVDPGATATDNCGGNLTSSIKITGTADANTPGIYALTYSVTDASGNTVSLSRTVTVVDTRAPLLTLLGANPFFVPCGKTYEEPGFSASDACAGDLTSGVVVSGSVDASAPGTYTLTYTVTDPSGNTSVATRRVEVSTGIIEGGQLFPIAVGKDSLSGAAVGDVVANIFNGVRPGNFGWITWSGSASAGALATSLLPPGNSDTYQNPYNANDHILSVGDWVMGNTGVSDSGDIRAALDILKQFDITVPVYDLSTSSGSGALYHIVAFARVRLTAYDLSQKTISARFLGYVTCSCEGNDLMNMSLQSSFNIGNINAGSFLWFNGVLHVSGMKSNAVKIRLVNQTITGGGFNLSVSNASVIFDPAATNATVDFVNGEWLTRVPMTASNENVFLSGLAYQLPAGISGKTKAYWNGTFLSDTPDVTLSWKWAVAPYSTLPSDGRLLGVKPVDNGQMSIYKNADLAGTPENYKGNFIAGKAAGYTGAYSGVASVSACHNLNGQSMAVPKGVTVLPLIGGKHSVMWTAKPGKIYKVQFKDSLTASGWTDLPGTVTATDAVASSIDNSVSPLTQRFYRIVMLP